MRVIDISSISGLTDPYLIQVCDVYGSNCVFLSQIFTTVPPTVTIYLPPQFDSAPSVMVKVTTLDGCEKTEILDCISLYTLTPTPTPSITPTLTPTPTLTQTPTVTPTQIPNCTIWTWDIYASATASIDYYDCNNVFTTLPIISVGVTSGTLCVYPLTTPVWNPAPVVSNQLGTSGIICFNPTQTPTPTPTNTKTPTPTPFNWGSISNLLYSGTTSGDTCLFVPPNPLSYTGSIFLQIGSGTCCITSFADDITSIGRHWYISFSPLTNFPDGWYKLYCPAFPLYDNRLVQITSGLVTQQLYC